MSRYTAQDRAAGRHVLPIGVGASQGVGRRATNQAKPLRPGQHRCPVCGRGALEGRPGLFRGHGTSGINCPNSYQPLPEGSTPA